MSCVQRGKQETAYLSFIAIRILKIPKADGGETICEKLQSESSPVQRGHPLSKKLGPLKSTPNLIRSISYVHEVDLLLNLTHLTGPMECG